MRRALVHKLQSLSKDRNRAVLSAISYSLATTLLNLLNKVVFSRAGFNFQWGAIAIQNGISLVILSVFMLLSPYERFRFHPNLARSLLAPVFCFSLFLYSNAKALGYINLPVLTVIKSFAPLGVSALELFLFKDPLTMDTALCMLLVVASNYVTASNDVEFSARGYAWAAVNVASNIAYLLSLRKCLSEQYDMITSAYHSTFISLGFIVPISVLVGDFPAIVYSMIGSPPRFQLFFLGSGVLAAGITISTFWCLKETNGSTLSFLGAMNKIPIVLLGAYLFNSHITPLGWVGIVMSILAGFLFARTKIMGRKADLETSPSGENPNADLEIAVVSEALPGADENGRANGLEKRV